jgi:hypothetical protein
VKPLIVNSNAPGWVSMNWKKDNPMLQGDNEPEAMQEKAAWHEAGHAVMLLLLRRPVYSASIEGGEGNGNGIVMTEQRHLLPYIKTNKRQLQSRWVLALEVAIIEIMVAYAGVVVEEYVFGTSADELLINSKDEQWMKQQLYALYDLDIGLGLGVGRPGLVLCWPALKLHIRGLLSKQANWQAVAIIAKALLQHGYLSGKQIIDEIEQGVGEGGQLSLFTLQELTLCLNHGIKGVH